MKRSRTPAFPSTVQAWTRAAVLCWAAPLLLVLLAPLGEAHAQETTATQPAAPPTEDAATAPGVSSEVTSAPPAPTTPAPAPMLAPAPVQARDYERAPEPRHRPRTHQRSSKLKGTILLSVGLGLFAGGYLGAVLNYALNSSVYDATLTIPLVGPWLTLGSAHWEKVDETQRSLNKLVLGLDGVLQIAGIAVLVTGIVVGTRAGHAAAPARFHFAGGAWQRGVQGSLRYTF